MNCLKSIGLGLLLIILCDSRGHPCGQYGTFCHNSSHFGICIEQLDGSLLPAEDYLNLCPEGTVCDPDDESPCIAMTSSVPQQFLSTADYMTVSPHMEVADHSSSDVDHHLAKSSVGVTSELRPSSKAQLYSVSKKNYDSTAPFTVSTTSTVLPSGESTSLNIVNHDYLTRPRANTKDNYITANQNLDTLNLALLNSNRNKRDWETTTYLQQTKEAFLSDLISTVTNPSMFSDATILNEKDRNIISTATTNGITNVVLPLETEQETSNIIFHPSIRVTTESESHLNNQQTKGSQVLNATKQTKAIENEILTSQINKGIFTTSKSTKNESIPLLLNKEIAIINDVTTEKSLLQNNVSVTETKWPYLFDNETTVSEQLTLINTGITVVNEMKNLPNPTTTSSYDSIIIDKNSAVTDKFPPINSHILSTDEKVSVIEQISKVNEVTIIMNERTEINTEKSLFKNSISGYNDDVFTTEQVSRLDDGETTNDESSTKQFTFKDNKTMLVNDYSISTENSTYLNNERIHLNESSNTTEELVSSTNNMVSGKKILTFNTGSSILNNEITSINDVLPETRVPLLLGGKIISVKEESEITEQSFSTGKTPLNFETPTIHEKSPLINGTKTLTSEISYSTKESPLTNNKIIPINKVVSTTEKEILTNNELILNDNLSTMTEQSMLSNKRFTITSDVSNESKQTTLEILVNKESHGIEQLFSSTGIPLIEETSIVIDTYNLSNNTTFSINEVSMETKRSPLFTNKTSISEILSVTEQASFSNKQVTSSDAESNVRKQTVLLNNEIANNNQVSDKSILLSTQGLVFTKKVQTVNEQENVSNDELTLTEKIYTVTEQAAWPNNIVINTIKKSNEYTQSSSPYIVFTSLNVVSNESLQPTQSSQDVNYINSVTQKKKPSILENNEIPSKDEVLSVTEILSSITDKITPKDKLSNVSTESSFSNNENKLSFKIPLVLEQTTLSSLLGVSNNNVITVSNIFNASKMYTNDSSFTNILLFPNNTQTSDIIVSAEKSLLPNSQVKSTYIQTNETINNENNTNNPNLITEEITSENTSKIPTNVTNNTSEYITSETVEILLPYDTTFGNEQVTLGDSMSLKYNQFLTTEQTIIIQNNGFTGDNKQHSTVGGVEISKQKFSNISENTTSTNYLLNNKSLIHIEPTTVSKGISPSNYQVPSIIGQTVAINNILTSKNKYVMDTGIVGLENNPERSINVVVKNNTRNKFIANMTGTSNHDDNISAITTSLMKKNPSSYDTRGQTPSSVFINITTNDVKNVSTSPANSIERKFNYGEKLSSSKTVDEFSIVPTTSVLFTLKHSIPSLPMDSATTSSKSSRLISKSINSVYISPTTKSQSPSNDIFSQLKKNSKVTSSDLHLLSNINIDYVFNTEPSYSYSSLTLSNHSSDTTLLNKLGLKQINRPSFIPTAADRLSSINQTKNVGSSTTNLTSSVMLLATVSSVTQPHPTSKMLYTPTTENLLSEDIVKQNIFVRIGPQSSTEQVNYEKPTIRYYHNKGTTPIPSKMKVEEALTPSSEQLTSRLLPGPLVYLIPKSIDSSDESNESKLETLKSQVKTKNNKHNNTKIPKTSDSQPGLYTIPNMDKRYLSKPTTIKPNVPIVKTIESLEAPNKVKSRISNVSLTQVPLVIKSEEVDSSNESKEENRKTSKEHKRTKHRTSRPMSFSNVSVPVISSNLKTEEHVSSDESEEVSMGIPKTHSKTKSPTYKNTKILNKEKIYRAPRLSEIYFTTPTITKYTSTLSKNTHSQFQCTQVGLFGDKTNCKKYHICYTYLFWFKQQDIQCTGQEGFSSIRKSCVPILLSDCYLGNQINKVKINSNIEESKLRIHKRKPHNSEESDES